MARQQTAPDEAHDPQKDFDFLIGTWTVRNRKLKKRLAGCTKWEEFDARVTARHVWDGRANMDEFVGECATGPVQGMTLRLFDPKAKQWSLYWANSASGRVEVPVVGGFKDSRGEFYNQELFEGRSVYLRFIWSDITPTSCRWEQAFSVDGGKSWETNWTMSFSRVS